jgi:hypothetical protein
LICLRVGAEVVEAFQMEPQAVAAAAAVTAVGMEV